eukprot:CAMPEP_0181296250 /NCGR_PEP_ID=MMETSP1101-20121128/4597_1 /TAXON_ID=46948 /ORGANISM="Rhodomonas abbreviata, Strain Caron Lab Isolate" /LENGTH=129 /DNA_ID=CAMNT_0023401089 /DNA_START=302 /DNA_END=691 /DNA_ORIENTATION=+
MYEPEVLRVYGATPLHYAICCGALRAASALAIAFPHLSRDKCYVDTDGSCSKNPAVWTTLDFASYFCNLYLNKDRGRHESFRQTSVILLTLQQNPSALPFLQFPTPRQRLVAAGRDAEAVLETFRSVAS